MEKKETPAAQENKKTDTKTDTGKETLQKEVAQPENQMFSEKGVLFKKEGNGWTEKSAGMTIGKRIESRGAQLIFAMENTRVILNALIAKKAGVKNNGKNVIFAAIDEEQPGIFCLQLENEEVAAKVVENIKSACIE